MGGDSTQFGEPGAAGGVSTDMRARILFLLVLAGSALAEEALVEDLASEDPGVRAAARDRLDAVAFERRGELRTHARHPDPEVAATVREVLARHGVFEDEDLTLKCAELLQAVTTEVTPEKRKPLLAQLLALGPEVRRFVAWEISQFKAEPVEEPDRVVEGPRPVLQVRFRNTSTHGIWFCPGDFATWAEIRAFGDAYEQWWPHRWAERTLLRGRSSGEAAVARLACLTRIPPGATFAAAGSPMTPHEPGQMRGALECTARGRAVAQVEEQEFALEPAPLPAAPTGEVTWFEERTDRDFASLERDGEGIRVKTKEPVWWRNNSGEWFALDAAGRLLDHGRIETHEEREIAEAHFAFDRALPENCDRVWVVLPPPGCFRIPVQTLAIKCLKLK